MDERHKEWKSSCWDDFTDENTPEDIPTEPQSFSNVCGEDEALSRKLKLLWLMLRTARENKACRSLPPATVSWRTQPGRRYDASGSPVPMAASGPAIDMEDTTTANGSWGRDALADVKCDNYCCGVNAPRRQRVHEQLSSSLNRLENELNAPQGRLQHMFQSEGWEGVDTRVCDWEPLRKLGHDMIDYVADYFKRIETFPVRAQVKPGYLKERLNKKEFPRKGDKWIDIMSDVESHVMPGITHWQHPSFFGYFPCNTCPPGVLADIVVNMFNVVSFSWEASPAATELEIMVMDQLARALGLPDTFQSTGEGGGVIQTSASETTLIGMLAARTKTLKHLRRSSPGSTDQELFAKMTFYTSDQAHSSILKTANIVGLGANLRVIPASRVDAYAMDVEALEAAMREDRANGLVPTFVAANVGSTNSCAIDSVRAMGEVSKRCPEGQEADFLAPWLHVDAAYAGSTAVCPENRWIFDGIEAADSLGVSLHKALLVNWDCAAMWAKHSVDIMNALSMTPPYLMSEEYRRGEVTDFKDWQISLGRRCRSLKLWFVMRAYGLDKVRAFVRHYTKLALQLDALIRQDDRFELAAPTRFGLVVFRLKASDEANEELRSRIVASGEAFFSPTKLEGRTCLRVAIGATTTEERHIKKFWGTVQRVAGDVLSAAPPLCLPSPHV